MDTALLERLPVPDVDPGDLINHNVLMYAEQQLGYKHPENDRTIARSQLTKAFRVMGLKPFSLRSVEQYKESETTRYAGSLLWRILARLPEGVGPIVVLVALLALVATIALPLTLSGAHVFNWKWEAIPVCFLILFAGAFLGMLHAWRLRTLKVEWQRTPIQTYKGPVPEFALATAMELHERVAGVTFEIDELVVGKIQRDPFLVVSFNGQEHYLEVWAEPGYKQERMA